MDFVKAVEGLNRVVKIILAIFIPIIFVICRIIADVNDKRNDLLVWDILLGIFPLSIVFWIMNLISEIMNDKMFTFATWFPGSGTSGDAK
jgi:hypothetical protein